MSKTLRKNRRLNEERAVLPFAALRQRYDFGMVTADLGTRLTKRGGHLRCARRWCGTGAGEKHQGIRGKINDSIMGDCALRSTVRGLRDLGDQFGVGCGRRHSA